MKQADRTAANRYGLLLMMLVVVYVVTLSADGTTSGAIALLLQLITLWLAFSASESETARKVAGVACGVVAVLDVMAFGFGRLFDWDLEVLKGLSVVSVVLYVVAPAVILRHLIRRPIVDLRTVLGAICIYLMMGMMFAFTYRSIAVYQPDPAFFGAAGQGSNADFLFFSFITLTTTGYGNLVPVGNPGQSVAVLETIVGQLFLVTALAKIVNSWNMSPTADSDDDKPS